MGVQKYDSLVSNKVTMVDGDRSHVGHARVIRSNSHKAKNALSLFAAKITKCLDKILTA